MKRCVCMLVIENTSDGIHVTDKLHQCTVCKNDGLFFFDVIRHVAIAIIARGAPRDIQVGYVLIRVNAFQYGLISLTRFDTFQYVLIHLICFSNVLICFNTF